MTDPRIDRVVPADAEGRRLDHFLAAELPEHTRSALRRLIESGHVRVDGVAAAKPGISLRTGMRLEVTLVAPPDPVPQPEDHALKVLWEDDDLIAVDKPAGMVVHAGHGVTSGTLVNALLGRGTPLAPAGGAVRPGIVHRLDRGTSGVLVVAKTDRAHRALSTAFAERDVRKRYVALVWGHPRPESDSIERPIGRSRVHPTRMSVEGVRGRARAALTEYTTREWLPGFSLLDVELHTGRTHQIRVHLSSIHHAVVGDETYGGRPWHGVQDPAKRKALRGFDRLALHASRLVVPHPATGAPLRLRASIPPDIEALLEVLRSPS